MLEYKGKRLLVLGCGYLGKLLAAEAISRGASVLAVSRNADTLAEVAELGAETFCGLLDDDSWHEVAGRDIDFLVNCVSSAGGGLVGYRQSYIAGNQSICNWAASVGFSGRSIYTSSVSVYGDAGGEWIDELSAPAPSNERGELIRESEEVFLKGMPVDSAIVLRLGGLYGPGRHMLLNRLKNGESSLPGFGDYYLNLVRIEDVVSSVWACLGMKQIVSSIYTVVDDEPSLKCDIVSWLASRLGNDVPKFTGAIDSNASNSRRLEIGGRPANRRISNKSLKSATDWRPCYANYRKGFEGLLSTSD